MARASLLVCLLATEQTAAALQPSPRRVTTNVPCSRRTAASSLFGAAAIVGFSTPSFADEAISPAKAKILAAKQAQAAKQAEFSTLNPTSPQEAMRPKQAVVDSSAQGRKGKAQSAQDAQRRIMAENEAYKAYEKEQRRLQREAEKARETPPSLPSLPSLPKLF